MLDHGLGQWLITRRQNIKKAKVWAGDSWEIFAKEMKNLNFDSCWGRGRNELTQRGMESFQVTDNSMKKAECLWPFTSHLTKDHLLYISKFSIFSTSHTMALSLGIRI